MMNPSSTILKRYLERDCSTMVNIFNNIAFKRYCGSQILRCLDYLRVSI
jgi:hypothetical protein